MAFLLWIPTVGAGIRVLLKYANTPGAQAAPPQNWPRATDIRPQPGLPELVVFAHPKCPCSKATVGELALLMARSQGRLGAHVVFYAPRSEKEDWVRTDLWNEAAAIPGVAVLADWGGREVRRFGVSTSGQAMLYNAKGWLLFKGGITAARGHLGPNDGIEAVESFVEEGTAKHRTAPVFGCSLFGAE